jgi:hypothetical protein
VIRVAEVQRYDEEAMSRFQWDPMEPPSSGSLKHTEHTVFLVKKNNNEYMRVDYHEILNTEIRALLFRHSYGYDMALIDFGKLTAVQSHTLKLRMPYEAKKGALKAGIRTDGMNFLVRDFGIVRVKTLTMFTNQDSPQGSPRQQAIREIEGGSQQFVRHDIDSDEEQQRDMESLS